jgi:hypothetical protein
MDVKKIGAYVGALTVIAGAVLAVGAFFSHATDDHTWSDRERRGNEPPIETIVAQVEVQQQTLDKVSEYIARQVKIDEREQARIEERERYDRALCARGVDPREDPTYCDRRGYPKPAGERHE